MIDSLEYNPSTGLLIWRVTRGKAIKGNTAGSIQKNGYLAVNFQGKKYLSHRLAWFLYYGSWPKYHIDHIDRNPLNNSIENLRDVSRSTNMLNTDAKGWEYDRRSGKYLARIMVEGRRKSLGSFKCPTAAHFKYKQYKKELTK